MPRRTPPSSSQSARDATVSNTQKPDLQSATTAPRYIVIEGPIGVGKSTLTRILAERLGARTLFEVVEENPFLPLFYSDREKHAFQTQIFFLLSRFRQQQSLFQQDLFNQVTVSDYLFAKDRIFASLTLNRAELALYDRVFEELMPRVMKPDLVIYLQANLDVLLKRIARRGREFEASFDAEYLANLCHAYNEYFARYADTPLLVANTDEINFVNEAEEVAHLLETIRASAAGVRHHVSRARTLLSAM
jgi:deoxyadenosine/deoxycytidine kinase